MPQQLKVESQLRNIFNTVSRPIRVAEVPQITVKEVRVRKFPPADSPHLLCVLLSLQEFQSDKRFHPSIIGFILAVFMFCVSVFISHMEDISYFDAFYACFITYSTIGFGDFDIYRISYRRV